MPSRSLAPALTLAVALAVPLTGCLHATREAALAPAAPTPAPAAAAGDAAPARVLVTGSRVPQPVDPATGKPRTTSRLDVYSSSDLERSGTPDLAKTLRDTVPTGP